MVDQGHLKFRPEADLNSESLQHLIILAIKIFFLS